MLKKILLVVGVLAALAAALLIFVFTKTAGMPDEADAFFEKLKKGDFAGAYSMTASGFQRATSVEQLAKFSEIFTFDKMTETSYSARGFENETGYLEGTIKYSDGVSQSMRIDFVKEGGDWKIFHVKPTSEGGLGTTSSAPSSASPSQERQTAPPEDIARALVNQSILMLADAIVKRDFTDFYNYTSNMWQSQTTKEELLVAFKEFIDKEIDLIHTQNTTLTIKDIQIDLQNALNIDAEWDTKPVRTVGNFRYVKEGDNWKLIGVAVNLKE